MNYKRIAILGSTGNIGKQAMEVIAESEQLSPCVIAGRNNLSLLAKQARADGVEFVAVPGTGDPGELKDALPRGVELLIGEEALSEAIVKASPDMVLSAVVGSAGLRPALVALKAGIELAIANKEALVCGGEVIMPAAKETGAAIIPVDSEHCGIYQCLHSGTNDEVRKVYITSSGGSLREFDDETAAAATVEQVLQHPNWNMGPKVTVDSATLMNKALEIVEAHHLFQLPPESIEILIHPQSLVHAAIEFCDSSIMAQIAMPDMKLPIAYALHYPDRPVTGIDRLNLATIGRLDFRKPEGRELRPLALANEVIRRGDGGAAVMNAANEVVVRAFLDGSIIFGDIIPAVENVVDRWYTGKRISSSEHGVTIDFLLSADRWARAEASRVLERYE